MGNCGLRRTQVTFGCGRCGETLSSPRRRLIPSKLVVGKEIYLCTRVQIAFLSLRVLSEEEVKALLR